MTQTIHQVNREALAAKLANMGIYPAAVYLENHATVAVEEFLAFHGSDGATVEATGCGLVLDPSEVALILMDWAKEHSK